MDRQTHAEVFVNAVEDALKGTPHARHPVQFEPLTTDHFYVCTLCGSMVPAIVEWKDLHRKNHDDHNRAHGDIEEQARRYVSPPRYG